MLFEPFMRFLGHEKLRNAGFPDDCASNEDRESYCASLNQKMDFRGALQLATGDIVDDPAACKFWKNCINHFCGVWAQDSSEYTDVVLVRSQTKLDVHLNRKGGMRRLMAFDLVSERVAAATFSIQKRQVATSTKGNCVIYAFITSYLRVLMYEKILELAANGFVTLFTSTDSILFVGKRGNPVPLDVGHAFGCFKPVLPGGADIRTFSSVGPSNYLVEYNEAAGGRQQKVSVKGLTVTKTADNPLRARGLFKRMLDGLYDNREESVSLLQQRLRRVPKCKADLNCRDKWLLRQRVMLSFKFSTNPLKKRVLKKDVSGRYITRPFGFKPLAVRM